MEHLLERKLHLALRILYVLLHMFTRMLQHYRIAVHNIGGNLEADYEEQAHRYCEPLEVSVDGSRGGSRKHRRYADGQRLKVGAFQ